MSELRTNKIIPRDGILVSGTGVGGGIIQINVKQSKKMTRSSSTSKFE